MAGFAAITSSTSFPIAPSSEICFRPFAAMIASAAPSPAASPAHIASNTSFAILPEIVPSAIRARSPASAAGFTGACAISISARFSAADTSPSIQFATVLGSAPPARTASSK